MEPGTLGVLPHPVEEHGLADTAEADQEHALGRSADLNPLQRHLDRPPKLIPASELGWRCARSWGVGIPHRIHGEEVIGILGDLQEFYKSPNLLQTGDLGGESRGTVSSAAAERLGTLGAKGRATCFGFYSG